MYNNIISKQEYYIRHREESTFHSLVVHQIHLILYNKGNYFRYFHFLVSKNGNKMELISMECSFAKYGKI